MLIYKAAAFKKVAPIYHDPHRNLWEMWKKRNYKANVRQSSEHDESYLNGKWLSTKQGIEWIQSIGTYLSNYPDEEELFQLRIRIIEVIHWQKIYKEYDILYKRTF